MAQASYGFAPTAARTDVYRARVGNELTDLALRIGFVDDGTTLFEIIEPLDDSGPISEHLHRHGPGLHHVAYVLPEIETARAHLDRDGYRLIVDGGAEPGDSRWQYFAALRGGPVLEIIQRSTAWDAFASHINRRS